MKYDLEIHDRAKSGTENHTYMFLTTAVRDLLTRERVRSNRIKIARSHGERYGAPAPEQDPPIPEHKGKGKAKSVQRVKASQVGYVSIAWLKGKHTRGDKCKCPHRNPSQRSRGSRSSRSR